MAIMMAAIIFLDRFIIVAARVSHSVIEDFSWGFGQRLAVVVLMVACGLIVKTTEIRCRFEQLIGLPGVRISPELRLWIRGSD